MDRAAKAINWMIDRALLIVFILFFLVGAYSVYDSLYVYSGASTRNTMVYKPGSEEEVPLGELSDDVVCWLTLDGTGVDFPVMQGATNSEYLNKDPYGRYSLSGSIFLDFRNEPGFSDAYNLVYGHHMEAGAMFGALDAYMDRDFYESHRCGTLTTTDGKAYSLTVFAVAVIEVTDEEIFDPEGEYDIVSFLREASTHFDEPETGHLLALTTCKKPSGTDRTAVVCCMKEI